MIHVMGTFAAVGAFRRGLSEEHPRIGWLTAAGLQAGEGCTSTSRVATSVFSAVLANSLAFADFEERAAFDGVSVDGNLAHRAA